MGVCKGLLTEIGALAFHRVARHHCQQVLEAARKQRQIRRQPGLTRQPDTKGQSLV
jgi:hypothetical protein